MANIVIDDAIFTLQKHGGISTLWRKLIHLLPALLPEHTFDGSLPADVYLSSYYRLPPVGAKSVLMVYDFIHERYPYFPPMHPDSVAKRVAIQQADKLIAISQWTGRDIALFCQRDSVVAYPATDFTRIVGLTVQPYVIVVGRRGGYKNVRVLYEAWRKCDIQLKIMTVGGEPPNAEEQALASRGLWQQVNASDTDLQLLYSSAVALVYPSFYEGFGLPILDAMACGCPVVCGNGGAIPESAGNAAVIIDVFSPLANAEAVLRLYQDYDFRLRHILAGYEQVEKFSWDQFAQTVAQSIQEIV